MSIFTLPPGMGLPAFLKRQGTQIAITAIVIFFFLFLAFRTGLDRGVQDRIADESWGRAQFAIGAAITSMKHGGYGYTIASPVKTVLEYAGLTGDPAILKPLGFTFPDNLRNPPLINKAIAKASEFKWPFNPGEGVSGNGGDDVGMVDFVRLSFLLFGFNVLSFYLTYFAVCGVSLLCAVVAFRRHPGVLAVFIVASLALPVVFMSSLVDPETNGILDPRFLSTLAVIPASHLALAMLARSPLTRSNAALAAVQACIVVFACWIRTSATWTLIALMMFAALLAARMLMKHEKDFRRLWPAGLLGALAVAHFSYIALALHPVYWTANERPHHGLWHPMLYAMEVHPQWGPKYAARFDGAKRDELPEMMAKKYLLRHPPADPDSVYLTADREYVRAGVTEKYKKLAFLEFFASDPRHVLESFFIYNVRLCYKSISWHLPSLGRVTDFYRFAAIAAIAMIAIFLLRDALELRLFVHAMSVLTAGFLLSFAHLIVTAPGFAVVSDQFFMLLVVVAGWGGVAFASAARWLLPKA